MLNVTIHFTGRETAPEVCQLRISLPKRGCVVSHVYIRGEDREKQAVARTRKTIPGISGTTSATTPMATQRQPRAK